MRTQSIPVIEGYQILAEIGRGGIGVVYSAIDLSSGQHVAIKVLSRRDDERDSKDTHTPQSFDESSGDNSSLSGSDSGGSTPNESSLSSSWFSENLNAQRLFQELAATTRVKHSHVVRVLDFGVAEDQALYVVMELLVGVDMSTFLKRNAPLPLAVTLRLFCEMLEALVIAHEQKILHRDIKPSNLFITHPERIDSPLHDIERSRLVVMDFGIARRIKHKQHKQQLIGSLPYMAPEYLLHGEVTSAGDVYQLGLTLIELITGARVVNGKGGMAIIYQHIQSDLMIPPTLKRGDLGEVITRSVTLDPKQRYPDARALLEALSSISPLEVERTGLELIKQRGEVTASADRVALGSSQEPQALVHPSHDQTSPQTPLNISPQVTPPTAHTAEPQTGLRGERQVTHPKPSTGLERTPRSRSLTSVTPKAPSSKVKSLNFKEVIEQSDLRAEIERLSEVLAQQTRSTETRERQLLRRIRLLSLSLIGLLAVLLITLSILLSHSA